MPQCGSGRGRVTSCASNSVEGLVSGTLTKQAQHGRTARRPLWNGQTALPASPASRPRREADVQSCTTLTKHVRSSPVRGPAGGGGGDGRGDHGSAVVVPRIYALAGSRAWRAPPWNGDDGISMVAAWGETWESGGRKVGFCSCTCVCTYRRWRGFHYTAHYLPWAYTASPMWLPLPCCAARLPGCRAGRQLRRTLEGPWQMPDRTRPPVVRWSNAGMVWFLTADGRQQRARTEGRQNRVQVHVARVARGSRRSGCVGRYKYKSPVSLGGTSFPRAHPQCSPRA